MKYRMAVLLGAICYGILSTIVTKAYGKGFTLGEVVGSQLATGCLLAWALVLAMAVVRRKRSKRGETRPAADQTAPRTSWKQAVLLMAAGMPTGLTGLLYYESLRYIPNSLAILLLFQFTWMGVLIDAVSRKRRPNAALLLTLAVLFGGTLLAAGILDRGLDAFRGLGVLFGFLSAVSYTAFILISGKAVPAIHPARRSAWMITGAMLFVFILFPPAFLIDGTLLGGLLPFGFMLGLFGAFLPPLLYAIGVPHIGEGLTGILGAAELPVAVLLSSVVLHERVSELQWAGVVLVLLGVALPELFRRMSRGAPRSTGVSS
ncbi:EamA family transporter [Cohnella nanjingensis]|uniref:EamA family transporter n=1 Tax=Cohnella nanjingensis TaxID=1387779 RepID=A0A7X0RR56_9BACL|nr:EamA family transporter [Cohnella nanjingensis]MBB6670729.1 EamA family transporter [Cohnella nanjingensis]